MQHQRNDLSQPARGLFLSSSQLSPHNASAASARTSPDRRITKYIYYLFSLSACTRHAHTKTIYLVQRVPRPPPKRATGNLNAGSSSCCIMWIWRVNARCGALIAAHSPSCTPVIWSTGIGQRDGARRAGGINRHHLPPPRRRPGHVQKTNRSSLRSTRRKTTPRIASWKRYSIIGFLSDALIKCFVALDFISL